MAILEEISYNLNMNDTLKTRLFKAGLALIIGGLIGFSSLAKADTFCQAWNDPTMIHSKKDFLLAPVNQVHKILDSKIPKEAATKAMQCYVENVDMLLKRLDHDCDVERLLTQHFDGVQVDTSDQEMSDITDYINNCVDQALKQKET